jgi:hypothetical protein
MLVPACGSRCAHEGASSEAEPARGRRGPSSEAEPARGWRGLSSEAGSARGGVSPRARQTSLEGGALLGRSGGPWGPSRRGLCCVRMFCVRFKVCLCFVFFVGFKQDSPDFLGDPCGCPRQTGTLSYLGSSTVPIRSVRPSSETTASLTSLAGSKEQAAHLDDSGTS